MNELTRITHTGATGHEGFTVKTGYGTVLAENATRNKALTALFHRGLIPVTAAEALNAAVRLDGAEFAIKGLPAD